MRQELTIRIVCLMALLCSSAVADGPVKPASEYQVRAAFLFNFVKFVEWPAEPAGPIELCILGKDRLEGELERVVDGKTVSGRPLTVRRVADAGAAQSCRLL